MTFDAASEPVSGMTGEIADLSTGLNQGRWAALFGADIYWVYSVLTEYGYNLIRLELAGTPRDPPSDFSSSPVRAPGTGRPFRPPGTYLPIAGRTPSIAGRPNGGSDWLDCVVAYVEEYSNAFASSPPFALGASTGRIAVCFPSTSFIPVTLDIDGSGQVAGASALAALGITTAELQKLATLYASGQGLWRVPIDHFLALN